MDSLVDSIQIFHFDALKFYLLWKKKNQKIEIGKNRLNSLKS